MILKIILGTIVSSSLLFSAINITDKNKENIDINNKNNTVKYKISNNPKEISVKNKTEDNTYQIKSTNEIIPGTNAESDNNNIINYIISGVDEDKVNKVLEKKESIERKFSNADEKPKLDNRTIYYNFKEFENKPINIYLKKGYSTEMEFVDELGNSIPVEQVTTGNNLFSIKQPQQHILTFDPAVKYKNTNMNIRLSGYNGNMTFRVIESDKFNNYKVDNFLKFVITNDKQNSIENNFTLKKNILLEFLKYETLHGQKELMYEYFDISDQITRVKYFDKRNLQIFKLKKFGQDFIVVKLHSNYEILGLENSMFSRYKNTFNIYFLPSTKEVFTIISKLDRKNDNLSSDSKFESDIGLAEKYRIVIGES